MMGVFDELLDEHKELFRQCADLVDGWQDLTKNELCRKYIEHKDNPEVQNSYFAAIMYRYWHLISKYYYMSNNVASPEDAYEWLEDSVYGCLKASSWDRADSSIYKDPNGPDKVINRCMKCARLTFYQFINRKKRKDNFGMASLEEMTELFGTTISEPESTEDINQEVSKWVVHEYIKKLFLHKDYFMAFMLDIIQSQDVFDIARNPDGTTCQKFSIRKVTRILSTLPDEYLAEFGERYDLDPEVVDSGASYCSVLKQPTVRAKIQNNLEKLQHDSFFRLLHGGT